MKLLMKRTGLTSVLTGLSFVLATVAFAAEYEIDFQAVSERRDRPKLEGPNVLDVSGVPFRLEAQIGKKWWVSTNFNWKVGHKDGGDFDIAFSYRMHHTVLPTFGGGLVRVNEAKNHARIYEFVLTESTWGDPFMARTLTVPLGCEEVEVQFCVSGTGWLEIDRLRLAPSVLPPDPVEIRCYPFHWLDGEYYLPSGQAGIVSYRWQTHPMARYDQDKISFELDVPKGFELSEAVFGDMSRVTEEPLADGGRRVRFPAEKKGTYPPGYLGPFFDNRYGSIIHDVLVKSTGAAGTTGDLKLSMWFDGKRLSNVETVRLVTVPTIRVQKPKRWQSGLFFDYRGGRFRTARGADDYVSMAAACGADWVTDTMKPNMTDANYPPALAAAWRKYGFRTRCVFWDSLADGYRIGPHEGRPAEDRFVSAHDLGAKAARDDARTRQDHPMGVCPIAVYEERPFFVTNTLPALAKVLKNRNGVWSNWEPWGYKEEGCYCTNCLKKFAAWLGKPVGEVAADWPDGARPGGKWRKEAVDFRVAEHAKMIRTIDRHVHRLTGEDSVGFIAAVSFPEMTSTRKVDPVLEEFNPFGYAGDVKCLNPWGPYPHWKVCTSYVYFKRDTMRTWGNLVDIAKEVEAEIPAGRRPAIIATTQGLQGEDWIPKPGWFEMAFDTAFFSGWRGMVPFTWGNAADARWWKAFADATARAAKYEDVVYDGRRIDEAFALEPVDEYAAPCGLAIPRLPKLVNASLLQKLAHEKDGRRIVAVFNFWDWAEAFFTLKATGLAAGEYTLVDEKGVRYTPSAAKATWSAAELAKGVFLEVPKTSTRVFEIVPAGEKVARTKTMTAADVRARFAARRSELARLAAADRDYEKANGGDLKIVGKGVQE